MAELKTKKTRQSVKAFLDRIKDEDRRKDCRALVSLMREATGAPPRMWGSSMVGFGEYRYEYASGRTGEWFLTGFSPRKTSLTVYIMSGFGEDETLLQKLGPHTTGKSCLYIKRLSDIHLPTLKKMVRHSVKRMAARGA